MIMRLIDWLTLTNGKEFVKCEYCKSYSKQNKFGSADIFGFASKRMHDRNEK